MKVHQQFTPEDFSKISKLDLYDLWFRQALTDKQIATLYGVTPSDVKEKRKEYNIRYLNSAIAFLSGSKAYRHTKEVRIKVEK